MAARQLLSPTRIGFFGILLQDSFYFDAIVIIIFLDFSKFLSKGFCQHSPDVIRNLQRFPPPPPHLLLLICPCGIFRDLNEKSCCFHFRVKTACGILGRLLRGIIYGAYNQGSSAGFFVTDSFVRDSLCHGIFGIKRGRFPLCCRQPSRISLFHVWGGILRRFPQILWESAAVTIVIAWKHRRIDK